MNTTRGACMVQNNNCELEKFLATLGLTIENLTQENLKKAYRQAASKYHSDKKNISEDTSDEKFKEVNKANEFLKQYINETGIGTSTYENQKTASDFFNDRFATKNKDFFASKEERELETIVNDVRSTIPQDHPANNWSNKKILHNYTQNLLANGYFRKGTFKRGAKVEEVNHGACDTIIPLRIKAGDINPKKGIAYVVNQLNNTPLNNKNNYLIFLREAHMLKEELAKDYDVADYDINQQAKQRIFKTTRNNISQYAKTAKVANFDDDEKTQDIEEQYLKQIVKNFGTLKDEINEYKTIGTKNKDKRFDIDITEKDFAKLHQKLYGEISEYVLESLEENDDAKALANVQLLQTMNILTGQENALEKFWNDYGQDINNNIGKYFIGDACERICDYVESELELFKEYQATTSTTKQEKDSTPLKIPSSFGYE